MRDKTRYTQKHAKTRCCYASYKAMRQTRKRRSLCLRCSGDAATTKHEWQRARKGPRRHDRRRHAPGTGRHAVCVVVGVNAVQHNSPHRDVEEYAGRRYVADAGAEHCRKEHDDGNACHEDVGRLDVLTACRSPRLCAHTTNRMPVMGRSERGRDKLARGLSKCISKCHLPYRTRFETPKTMM